MDNNLTPMVERLAGLLTTSKRMLVTAESCTGGLLAAKLTAIAGASQWFERGFITYTNVSKQEMLGVGLATLERLGAVSEAVVSEMVAGALQASRADCAVAISGLAGPDGAVPGKPVGTVCIAWAVGCDAVVCRTYHFEGDRQSIRDQAVLASLAGLLAILGADGAL